MKALRLSLWFLFHFAIFLGVLVILAAPDSQADAIIVGLLVAVLISISHRYRTGAIQAINTEWLAYSRHLELRAAAGKPPDESELMRRAELQKATEPTGEAMIAMLFASLSSLAALGRAILAAVA